MGEGILVIGMNERQRMMSCRYKHSARLMALLSGSDATFFEFSIDAKLRQNRLLINDGKYLGPLDTMDEVEVLQNLAQRIPITTTYVTASSLSRWLLRGCVN